MCYLTSKRLVVCFDSCNWFGPELADFARLADAEAEVIDSSTAVEGCLLEICQVATGQCLLPSALLLQRTAADEWALYGTYVPAPTGEQWARGALDFKASIGDVVSVDSSARLLPLQAPGKAKLPHPIMRFGGLVVGPGGARSDARYVMLHAPSAVYLTVLTQNVVSKSDETLDQFSLPTAVRIVTQTRDLGRWILC